MAIHVLDTVVLLKDLPESGLHRGDRGAVVYVDGTEAVEVEFVDFTGITQALVTLRMDEVRGVGGDDLPGA
jgi:Domain of unknown function (DUF4926)